MGKRIFLTTSIVCVLALVIFFAGSLIITDVQNRTIARKNVVSYTDIFADKYYDGVDMENFVKNNIAGLRVTVIDSTGKVLADSDENEESMDNHLNREEIVAAINGKPTVVVRKSGTQQAELMYYATKLDVKDGFLIIRCALSVNSINGYLINTLPLFIVLLVVMIIGTVVISKYLTKGITKPFIEIKNTLEDINEGKYEKGELHAYDEINSILFEIDTVSDKLQQSIKKYEEERNKITYILNSINDGILAVNQDKEIVLINAKTKEIFGATSDLTGDKLSYLTSNEQLDGAIDLSLADSESKVFELNIDGSYYFVTVKCTDKNWATKGKNIAVVVFNDITMAKQNQKIRQEFFDNASHELKTPLTTVKGFTELLTIQNKDEKLAPYISQIQKETDRMVGLIMDMLRLSELENGEKAEESVISLKEIAEKVIDNLSSQIAEKGIAVEISGDTKVFASEKDMYSLVKNLVENAVKYNVEGGKVWVTMQNNALCVKDTGIGIDKSHQDRIFERFYRINESRSRVSGGTGLGLSIVKHICNTYGADIKLNSSKKGTEITVTFSSVAE